MQNSDRYDINLMCECLHVSRSGFYRFFHTCRNRKKEQKMAICMRILSIHASDPLLGSPRITLLLHEEGMMIAQSTVSRYMRERWESPQPPRTSDSAPSAQGSPQMVILPSSTG